MNDKGMQIADEDGARILLPFDKVVKMEKMHEAGPLSISLLGALGASIKIKNKEEAARVWSAFQGWLMGFDNP